MGWCCVCRSIIRLRPLFADPLKHGTFMLFVPAMPVVIAGILGSASPVAAPDTSLTVRLSQAATVDTPRVRPRAVEVSDWYGRRLTIHRTLSYTVIPIFGAQWFAGERIYKHGNQAPDWAKTTHRAGASALAGIFTVNTVTGLWNLWDSRGTSNGRTLRTIHALSMLVADAGFTYAGVKLSKDAETDFNKRREHRTIALSSMALTVVSGLAMKLYNK
jgi:hypothetical protein